MQVIAEAAWDWLLFEDEGQLYLDVLVEHGAISYSATAVLSAAQAADYARGGAVCLGPLAAEMRGLALRRQWRAPALPGDWAVRTLAAIRAWRLRGG